MVGSYQKIAGGGLGAGCHRQTVNNEFPDHLAYTPVISVAYHGG